MSNNLAVNINDDHFPVVVNFMLRRGLISSADTKVETSFSFDNDLEGDSLDLAAVVMDIEEHYELDFSNEEIDNFKTVGDILMAINRHRQTGNA